MSFSAERFNKERRCQRPGRDASPELMAEYNSWRKRKTYWRNLPRLVKGVAYDRVS